MKTQLTEVESFHRDRMIELRKMSCLNRTRFSLLTGIPRSRLTRFELSRAGWRGADLEKVAGAIESNPQIDWRF
jgi:hypothetical protein